MAYEIAVFEGDGIGPEITAPTVDLLGKLATREGIDLSFTDHPAGAGHYRDTGEALPQASIDAARAADAVLLAACGLPDIRYPDGTEIVPQIDLRMELGLFAGVRPVTVPLGAPNPLKSEKPIDFVLVRESTEGLFHTMGRGTVTHDQAEETLRITRETSEKLFRFSFELARARKRQGKGRGHVTCVDKANVFRAFAFFRGIFDEVAADYPDIETGYAYVDAMALWMVERPETFDVLVTENMFGDILSDLGAGIMGGLGLAPSADLSGWTENDHGVFQPCHGSAPDIAGKGLANPTAMLSSAAMMMDWLAGRHDDTAAGKVAALLAEAIAGVVGAGEARTRDLGGTASTGDVVAAVGARLGL